MNLLSVVIPVRNGAATIAAQLGALAAQGYEGPWEVVVADNGSTDGTAAVVERFRDRLPRLRVVAADGGIGINVGRNAGIRAAQGDLILICDADDVVHPGWIAAHAAALAQHDITGGPLDEDTLNSGEIARFNARSHQDDPPISGRFLPYASGGNCGFRRQVWERIGGFDSRWQRGATEIEFCWRAQIAGFRIGWAPDAVVAYRHDPALRSEVRRRYRSARAITMLYAQFRRHGMPPARPGRALRAWGWLVFRAPWALADAAWRLKWLQVAAWRAGLLAGSARYRVVYL